MPDPGDVVNILPEGNLKEDLDLIEGEYILEAMMQLQELPREERRTRNKNFVASITEYKGGSQEGFIWMNEHLHGSTCKTILEDLDYKGGCKDKVSEKLEDAKDSIRAWLGCAAAPRADGMSFCSILKRIRMAVTMYSDVFKDILVFTAIFQIVWHMNRNSDLTPTEEIVKIFTSDDFPSVLVQLMFLSIVIPLTTSAITVLFRDPTIILGNDAWNRMKKNEPAKCKVVAMKIFNFVCYFMMPAVLINAREAAKSKQQLWIESAREATKTNTITLAHLVRIREFNEYLEETRVSFLIFKRNELTLENILQIFLQGVMVLLSPTYTKHTATYSGLQSVFKEKETSDEDCTWHQLGCAIESTIQSWMPIDEETGRPESSLRILLMFSVVLSIKTTATTYIKIKTEEKKKFFPILSKLLLAVRALLAYSTRTVCIVGFFVPFLGLLDVLAHWKSEQMNADISEKPVPYDKYTGMMLGPAFGLLILLLLVQTTIGMIVKLVINKEFRETSVGNKLQHLFLVANLPDNYGTWTSGGGGVEDLRKRQKMHILESGLMIMLQFLSHIIMVIPFWLTGMLFKQISDQRSLIKIHSCDILQERTPGQGRVH